jgi:hypothetical protein
LTAREDFPPSRAVNFLGGKLKGEVMSKQNNTSAGPLIESKEFVDVEAKDAKQSLELVKRFEITNNAEHEFAANALAEVAKKHDAIDAKRKAWVDPLNKVVRDINATFKPLLSSLKDAEQILKSKIGDYVLAQYKEQERLLASVKAEDSTENVVKILERVAETVPTKVETLGTRFEWAGQVVDASILPREYLMPDIKKLEAITKATDGDPKIPGWSAYQVAAVRTARK